MKIVITVKRTTRDVHPLANAPLVSGQETNLHPKSLPGPLLTMRLASAPIRTGLIIREEPLLKILSGDKTWEMRSKRTTKRERIALVMKGSKAVFGVADIVDCHGPLSRTDLLESMSCHQILRSRIDTPEIAKYKFAWILANVRRLPTPVPYVSKPGQVIFVTIDAAADESIRSSLGEL